VRLRLIEFQEELSRLKRARMEAAIG